MTVGEWLRHAEGRLAGSGVEAARLEAQVLACHVLLVERSWLLAHGDAEFPELAGESLLQRREAHEPLAYILGWREFYGRRFTVNKSVLIPRHETETLVERAFAHDGETILDVGTGSGILAISLKLERPGARVVALDISPDALAVAKQNAEDLGAEVEFVLSDAFTEIGGRRFDLIVSNPPYIGLPEPLAAEVSEFEPRLALYSGVTGMEFYEVLASRGADYLTESGRLLMEIGYLQSASVPALFKAHGWRVDGVWKDLSGTDRVVEVRPCHN